MRVAFRHFLLDAEGTLYRLRSAALDRMLHRPTRQRLAHFAGQRVRSAEVVVEMMNGRPLVVLRSVFNMLRFKSDGTLLPPLRDRHVRARAELALALGAPAHHAGIAEASTRFVARGGEWTPSAALVRRIEQPPWDARNALEYLPPDPESNDCSTRSLGVVQINNRPITVACAPGQVAPNPTSEPDASGVSCQHIRHTGI